MSIDDMPPLGPAPEDLETRRLRQRLAQELFGVKAPNLMKIGRFELVAELGMGGQGTVYEAWDPELRRRVALKRLAVADPKHRDRVRQEGRALARVDHPNVVRIYEVGEDATDRPYLVMALVEGLRLDRWLKEAPRRWTDVVELIATIGDGLAAIHAAGVTHRDVKPSNIAIQDDGKAKLIELGIALLDTPESASAEPDAAGTIGYMAPECFGGRFDVRGDQYGVCVTLYEALCGMRPPLSMTQPESVHSGASGSWSGSGLLVLGSSSDQVEPEGRGPVVAIGLEAAPRRLREVLARGMQEEPEHRYDDMTALVAALRGVLPRPRQWSTMVVVGLLAMGAVAGASLKFVQPVPGLCAVASPAGTPWGESARQVVRDTFMGIGGPDADRPFVAVDGMLAETTAALGAGWLEACGLPDDDGVCSVALAELQSEHGDLGPSSARCPMLMVLGLPMPRAPAWRGRWGGCEGPAPTTHVGRPRPYVSPPWVWSRSRTFIATPWPRASPATST